MLTQGGVSVPKVIEVTFVRNDLVKQFLSDSNVSLPHELDEKNVLENEDIIMPDYWWK
jgi:hypothetical protein